MSKIYRGISPHAKYQLDWKMNLLFWFMRFVPFEPEKDFKKFRSLAEAKPRGLFRHFPVAQIENRSIPGRQGSIPVRIYRPEQAGSLPVIVFFHGGGWVLGGLDSHHAICQRIAGENRALVVSVDYRLSPENKYPAALEDAYDATCWVAEHSVELGAAPHKLILMGDSAGGNLAAAVCLLSREIAGPRIALQVLIYPALDLGGAYPSKALYADNPVLNQQSMDFYTNQYIRRPADLEEPLVSPMLAGDLSNLPPALILTAEYDPLRDEGQAYADRLREAGIEVVYACYPGMVHGFFSFGRLANQLEPAFARIKQTLQRV